MGELFLLEGKKEAVSEFADGVGFHVDIEVIGNIIILFVDFVFVLT
jgi:hypothetical protein